MQTCKLSETIFFARLLITVDRFVPAFFTLAQSIDLTYNQSVCNMLLLYCNIMIYRYCNILQYFVEGKLRFD